MPKSENCILEIKHSAGFYFKFQPLSGHCWWGVKSFPDNHNAWKATDNDVAWFASLSLQNVLLSHQELKVSSALKAIKPRVVKEDTFHLFIHLPLPISLKISENSDFIYQAHITQLQLFTTCDLKSIPGETAKVCCNSCSQQACA